MSQFNHSPYDQTLRFALRVLDQALTAKDKAAAQHTAQRKITCLDMEHREEYYLSDGGYSRVFWSENSGLHLTSNSLDAAKTRWYECAEEREAVDNIMKLWYSAMEIWAKNK